jgi:dissimilatory sulfite reductase related protein
MSGLHSVQPGSIYTVLNVDGKEVTFDEEGFLLDPDLWNERLAEMLALEDGLSELSTIHWHILSFLREYYFANGKAPLNSEFRKGTGLSLAEIEACFPLGIRLGARRLAGLPNPRGCA